MKITEKIIRDLNPCDPGYVWYCCNGSEDLLDTLIRVNMHDSSWARWLFTHLMSTNQKREIAIFSAEQVLHFFETDYPDDRRPRKAIEAARRVLENDTEETREEAKQARRDAAYAAAYAADSVAYAAYTAADAAYAAYTADADIADSAAYTAADAAYAAAYVAAKKTARKEMQETIIKRAVYILDRDAVAKEFL